jgi:translation initiation factor 2B subunit (eIF-2B alpha/beta/delta family)
MKANDPLSKVFFDNTSGSSAILSQLMAFIINQANDEDWEEKTIQTIEFGIRDLIHFEVVRHFLESLNMELQTFQSSKDLISWVKNYEKEWSSITDKWVEVLLGILKDEKLTISTHSQSESLKSVFHQLFKSHLQIKIFQTQSGPANEGELQANWLVNKGIEVILTTDSIAPSFVEKCDIVLMGCDGIYSDGFINKAGSLALCLAAKQFGKPVYILADTRKISHEVAPEEKPKPSPEVSSRTHPNLEILNLYFEKVPHNLVTGYITEKGILEENI